MPVSTENAVAKAIGNSATTPWNVEMEAGPLRTDRVRRANRPGTG